MAKSVSTKLPEVKQTFKGRKFRVAIIGCGGIAQVHLEAFRQMPEVEIVAGVDFDPSRKQLMCEKWNLPKNAFFTDWQTMLDEIKPDAVDVCTPNALHCRPVIDACNAKCHVMVEKPMAMTPAECEEMIDAAERNNVLLAVGFQQRYSQQSQILRQARDEGRFGKIMFVRCQALRRRGIPNWGVFGRKDLQGGGPMIDIGVHILECAWDFMGSPEPVAASGNIWTYLGNKPSKIRNVWPGWDHKNYTVEDLAIGQIRFANGAILQIESSFAAHIARNDVFNFTVMGEKAGCSWETASIYTDEHDVMFNLEPAFIPEDSFALMVQRKLQNWVDACRLGTPLAAPASDGLGVQKMLDAIYRSAAVGREVTIE